jgi:UDP-N-acetylglucosamine--N-acetylmuramyl-(pentapeptide) pyrophosphoryl-undecaprenol N-acetylglucosamine transferase
MNNKLKKIIIATGGTGGHVFPAYSLAKHLIKEKIDIQLITDKRGMKYLKEYSDVNIAQIPSATISKKNIFKFSISILTILYSIFRSLILLLFNRANLVFGMGGYSSFPICIAAKILGIPFIIYENNLHIGKANKFLLPFAKKAFVSHLELEGVSNKYRNKLTKIGNIIRKEIINFQEVNNIRDEKIKVLILGGSQAAKVFGEKLPLIFKECLDFKIPLKIYQQCLPEQNEVLSSAYKQLGLDYEIFNFNNNILEYFSKINLAITRSGSSMLAELINAKIPFISIPLPTSADNHQLKNAIYYEKNQYSYLIEEKDLNKNLFKLIKLIHEDRSLLERIRMKQREYSDKSVYENIDREINKIIDEKN